MEGRDEESEVVDEAEAAEREAEANERRRARIRQQREEAEAAAASSGAAADGAELSGSEEEEEDEEEEESDDSLPGVSKLPPPVFRSKHERDTVKDRDAQQAEDARLEAERAAAAAARAAESHALLAEELQRSKDELEAAQSGDDAPDEDDGDERVEYEQWKLRELARIKRDKEEVERVRREEEELARRRGMSDAEIQRLDKERLQRNDKAKWNFLQKYWHKGAFYQDQDILQRDYSAPTEADLVDKTMLPKVMQVKNFGRAGRTKYTHLTDQDTTKFDAGWSQKNDPVANRVQQKLAGSGSVKRTHPG